jgi:hypothetical protein
MRALAFMLWESFGRELGRAVVAGEIDNVFTREFPIDAPVWCYLQVELDAHQEGVPIHALVESVPDGDGASGETVVLLDATFIGTMRVDPDRPVIYRFYEQVALNLPTPGYYDIRAYIDDELVSNRPIRAAYWPGHPDHGSSATP